MLNFGLKRILYIFIILGLWGCTSDFDVIKENQEEQEGQEIKTITMFANDLVTEEILSDGTAIGSSRTAIEMNQGTNGNYSGEFKWALGDTVGIFPDKGYQVAFSMAAGAGANYAEFDGGGWALKSNSTYSSYYPFEYNNRTPESIPVNYLGQKQNGKGSSSHLGEFDYMYTKADAPDENGNVNFTFNHLGSVLALHMKFGENVNLNSLELSFDEELLIEKGTINLKKVTDANNVTSIQYENTEKVNALVLDLEDFNVNANETAVAYMWIAAEEAIALAGKTLSLKAKGTNELNGVKYYTYSKPYDSNATGMIRMGRVVNLKDVTFTSADITYIADGVCKAGDGSYEISNANGLKWLADQVNNQNNTFSEKTVKLTRDIDLDGNYDNQWTPIGNVENKPFSGTFDGQNHKISNLYYSNQEKSDKGLFGFLNNGSDIKNIVFENVTLKVSSYAGAVAGNTSGGKISNIKVQGDVKVEAVGEDVSAVVGSSYSILSNITVNVNEGSYVKGKGFIGGIVGFMAEHSPAVTHDNLVSNIDVTGTGDSYAIGGVVGTAVYGNTITKSSSSGDIKSISTGGFWPYKIGGIVGCWGDATYGYVTLSDCVFTGTLTSTRDGVSETGFFNKGLVGASYDGTTLPNLIIDDESWVNCSTGDATTFENALKSEATHIIARMYNDVTLAGGTNKYYGGAETKDIKILSNGKTLTFSDSYRTYINLTNPDAVLTLEDVNVDYDTTSDNKHWHEYLPKFLCDVKMNNVALDHGFCFSGDTELNEVAFDFQEGDYYTMWLTASGQTVTMDNVTMTCSGRAIKIGDEDCNPIESVTLNVSNSTFKSVKKAAVLVSSKAGATINWGTGNNISDVESDTQNAVWVDEDWADYYDLVTVTGCTKVLEGFAHVTDGVMKSDSDTEYRISNKAGLLWLAGQVYNGVTFKDKTVKLTADINLENDPWTPIGMSGTRPYYDNNFSGVFDGQDHTISNLTVTNTDRAGLFASMCGGTIKNLIINGATLTSNHYAGAIVAWMEQGGGTFIAENCHVKNAVIKLTPDGTVGNYDNGDKAGAIAGFMHYGTITGCSAEKVAITAYRDLGGIVGYANGTTVTNNSVKDAKLTIDQVTNSYGAKEANVGQIIGRRGGVALNESSNTFSNVSIETVTEQDGNFSTPVIGGSL